MRKRKIIAVPEEKLFPVMTLENIKASVFSSWELGLRSSTKKSKEREKVQTLNPDKWKKGASVDKEKYELVKSTILASFKLKREQTKAEMIAAVAKKSKGVITGSSIEWHVMAGELDLEARGIISRIPDSSPILHVLGRAA